MFYKQTNKLRYIFVIFLACTGVLFSQSAMASDYIEKSGDIIMPLIPAIAYGSTFYLDDAEGRTQFYKSFSTNLAATFGLKYTINKKRPNGLNYSFPSGHTSIAFQGAVFVHKRYGLKYSIPAYIGASFVGYSRVESDNHYIEDVLAGAAIGAISGFYFTEPYTGITVTPVATKDWHGILISKKW